MSGTHKQGLYLLFITRRNESRRFAGFLLASQLEAESKQAARWRGGELPPLRIPTGEFAKQPPQQQPQHIIFYRILTGRQIYSSDRSSFFPITAALLSCLYNLLIAVSAAYYLPDDPLFIGLSISLYAWAGTILSICGLAGIILVSILYFPKSS